MMWNRTQFDIPTAIGMLTVSGWTSPAGIGLHIHEEDIDEAGRHRWHVTHLRSGIMFLQLHVQTLEEAAELGDLIVDLARYSEYEDLHALMKADPEWVPQLIAIKHVIVGDDRLEFPDPAMNDEANIVMLPHEKRGELAELRRRGLVSSAGEWLGEISEA